VVINDITVVELFLVVVVILMIREIKEKEKVLA